MPITSTGRKLIARSFEGSKADWIAHVCFDSYDFKDMHIKAPCVFFYKPEIAASIAKNKLGVSGSRAGATEKGTGFGAKVSPMELNAFGVEFCPNNDFSHLPLGDRGVAEVKRIYEDGDWSVIDATKHEQIVDKIDFVATKGNMIRRVEVKARGENKSFPDLFIQTHEANPDKRIS